MRQYAFCAEDPKVPESFRLLDLYEAARDDGHEPAPEGGSYRSGDRRGFAHAYAVIADLVRPTHLVEYVDPQFTFGYHAGLGRALRAWADQLVVDELIRREDTSAKDPSAESPARSRHAAAGEQRALERLVGLLCDHIELLIREARDRGRLRHREAELQLQAFAERKRQALRLPQGQSDEPCEVHIGRLQKAVKSLECSLLHFRACAAANECSVPVEAACERAGVFERIGSRVRAWLACGAAGSEQPQSIGSVSR